MSQTEVILRLALIALLSAYLLRQHARRGLERDSKEHPRPEPGDWEGTVFDAGAFRRAMAQSPLDYVESARGRSSHNFRHEARIAEARSRMAWHGWFRHRLPEEAAGARAA